jgi:hypothetical protein
MTPLLHYGAPEISAAWQRSGNVNTRGSFSLMDLAIQIAGDHFLPPIFGLSKIEAK